MPQLIPPVVELRLRDTHRLIPAKYSDGVSVLSRLTEDAKVLSDRLQHSVRTAPYRLTASIGVVATPIAPLVGHPPHDVIEELITIATSNMYVARTKGGQRTRATADPRLTSLEDIDSNDWDDDDLSA